MMENKLKEIMSQRPVFGMTVYSNLPQVVESLGYFGFDFAFIDTEHSPWELSTLKETVLAARFAGISPLVRVTKPDMVEIRKALEMGAEGVIVPHIHNKEEMELCIKAAKFPPKGRRGFDMTVRSAHYGIHEDNLAYIQHCLDTEMIIPMAEDYEFTDNLEEILSVEGIDAINFGPADYSMSTNSPSFYTLEGKSTDAVLKQIASVARPRGIGIMAPALPPTIENVQALIDKGVNMIIAGSDMYHIQGALQTISENIFPKYQ